MEDPRLGVELELQLPAYTAATATRDLSRICDLHHSSRKHQILNSLSEARAQTHIVMDTGQVHNLLSHNRNSVERSCIQRTCILFGLSCGVQWYPVAALLLYYFLSRTLSFSATKYFAFPHSLRMHLLPLVPYTSWPQDGMPFLFSLVLILPFHHKLNVDAGSSSQRQISTPANSFRVFCSVKAPSIFWTIQHLIL